jgi:signal peptide peptidase SppA
MISLHSELWACEDKRFRDFAAKYSTITPATEAAHSHSILALENAIAKIRVRGMLLKQHDADAAFWGIENTGYDEIESAIKLATEQGVDQIQLLVDSPGGMAQGVELCANTIFQARQSTKVTAIVDGMACSAAYWLASAASTIEAPRDAVIGSIGTFSVIYDTSGMAEKIGVKTIVVRYGDNKGAGVFGAEISEGQIAVEQGIVDTFGEMFVAGIARNRGMDLKQAEKLATGAYWLSSEAVKLQLVDVVQGESLAQKQIRDTQTQRKLKMENEAIEQAVKTAKEETAITVRAEMIAGLQALEAAFPDHPEFARSMWETGKTPVEAKADYADVLAADLAAARAELAAKPATIAPPVAAQPVETAPLDSGASPDYLALVKAYKAETKCTQMQAIKHVQATNPEAYQAYVGK